MSIIRYAQTDDQEISLKLLKEWGENANFRIRYGTSIGKHPQTIILDHAFQDGFIYVNSDGEIKINGEIVETENQFLEAVKKSPEI